MLGFDGLRSGTSYEEITIANTATTFSMATRGIDGRTCTYSGNYLQVGRIGRSQGNDVIRGQRQLFSNNRETRKTGSV